MQLKTFTHTLSSFHCGDHQAIALPLCSFVAMRTYQNSSGHVTSVVCSSVVVVLYGFYDVPIDHPLCMYMGI